MAAPANGTPKQKFNRKYLAYNPNRYSGPTTQIHDTVLKLVPEDKDA